MDKPNSLLQNVSTAVEVNDKYVCYLGPRKTKTFHHFLLSLIIFSWVGGGGGQIEPWDARISLNCLSSHHNSSALIKRNVIKFYTALVMLNN